MVELVEKPGDAKLSARIRELEADWAAKCEELEKVQAERQKENNWHEQQYASLLELKEGLEGRVTHLTKENSSKYSHQTCK